MPDNTPLALLGGLTPEAFLRDYWQKQPLCVRGALDPPPSLAPEELAGLACEDGVRSRLIVEQARERPWWVKHGPLTENDFAELPDSHWTLLVQDVNRYLPSFADLLDDQFSFLPAWRVEDVMVSYAPDQGSVGPHTDNYDVFLLQGLGRRRWRIGAEALASEQLLPGLEMRILENFQGAHEWILEPGDMLYLPPRYAHHGVALGECMTYSVGLRAPSHRELLGDYLAHQMEHMDATARYSDAGLSADAHPGRIDGATLARVRAILDDARDDEALLSDWFARFATRTDDGGDECEDGGFPDYGYHEAEIGQRLRLGECLRRNEESRYAYLEDARGTRLYVDGEPRELAPELAWMAAWLTDRRRHTASDIAPWLDTPGFLSQITAWLNRGLLEFDEPDDDDPNRTGNDEDE